jgi:hypothetical protein
MGLISKRVRRQKIVIHLNVTIILHNKSLLRAIRYKCLYPSIDQDQEMIYSRIQLKNPKNRGIWGALLPKSRTLSL